MKTPPVSRFPMAVALLPIALILLVGPAAAQFPTTASDNVTFSIGRAIIWVEPAHAHLVSGTPGWNQPSPGHWTSPFMYDGNTTIGHSAAHVDGDAVDVGGAIVGSAGSVVADNNFVVHPFEGPNGVREIHTEMYRLNLREPPACNMGFSIIGGTGMGVPFPSIGEVEANQNSSDFPASSFFEVYVEINTPFGVLYNRDPLVVSSPSINALPPSVVYIHGLTSAVNVYFKSNNQRFGILRLAGHQTAPGGQERCPDPCGYCPVRTDLENALEGGELMPCRTADGHAVANPDVGDCKEYYVEPTDGPVIVQDPDRPDTGTVINAPDTGTVHQN